MGRRDVVVQYLFSLLNLALGVLLVLRRPRQPVPRLLAFALLGTAATFNRPSHAVFHVVGHHQLITGRILDARPDTVVLLVSTYRAESLSPDMAGCGAVGFLTKEDVGPEILARLCRSGMTGSRP